jgi:hypothetical protein
MQGIGTSSLVASYSSELDTELGVSRSSLIIPINVSCRFENHFSQDDQPFRKRDGSRRRHDFDEEE